MTSRSPPPPLTLVRYVLYVPTSAFSTSVVDLWDLSRSVGSDLISGRSVGSDVQLICWIRSDLSSSFCVSVTGSDDESGRADEDVEVRNPFFQLVVMFSLVLSLIVLFVFVFI